MDYAQVKYDFDNAYSLRLLRLPQAPLIISFLYQQFKQQQRVTVAYQDLLENLEADLESIHANAPNQFVRPPKEYLDQWSKEYHLIRIHAGGDAIWMVDLSPDAERALRWLEELRQRPFVGTESRFLGIVATLREIVANSSDDPDARLAFLRNQQAELQKEIDTIERTGRVNRFNETQIRERFLQANENALRLLSDFATIEQNFRDLARTIQEAMLQPNVKKGGVLGDVLDADEALESSDEGRSFRAFWQFLLQPDQKDALQQLIRTTYALPELNGITYSSVLINMARRLLDAGQKIVASNHQLAEQLRRMLDEQVIAESQRVRRLCAEIKQMAFQNIDNPPPSENFYEIETDPIIQLPMDRPLWEPNITPKIMSIELSIGGTDEEYSLEALFTQFFVDGDVLRNQVEHLLDTREEATLQEVAEQFPVKKGMAELLMYLKIAEDSPLHHVDISKHQIVTVPFVNHDETAFIKIPFVRFRRKIIPDKKDNSQ